MIQLADVHLYVSQFMWWDNSSGWRKAVAEVISASQSLGRVDKGDSQIA